MHHQHIHTQCAININPTFDVCSTGEKQTSQEKSMGLRAILIPAPSPSPSDHILHGGEGLQGILTLVPLAMDVYLPAQHTPRERCSAVFAV